MTVTGTKSASIRSSIRKLNPGLLQSERDVVDQFVVRNRELDVVLEILHENIEAPSCQHVLIVAPRGRGKTMLLARTASELRTNAEFSKFLLPIRFMEESHEVFNIADFWLETLFHLARESAATHPQLARELGETYVDLTGRWGERTLGNHARAAVLRAADQVGRKLVLMVENLQALRGNVDEDFSWQLRAALQSDHQIMLLASATSRFEGLEDPGHAFFELFRTVDLKPLTTEECRRLWESISGQRVGARSIRPLEILTGGNPRLLLIVAAFSEHRSLRRLMEELVTLIDEHTEYFRSNLEALPKSERRVYVAVVDLWRPSNTGEIAARARMDVRVVSTMLGRLVDRGAVFSQSATHGRKRLYSASEPLYSIYYKLRRERDEAAVIESLIKFMVAFYESSSLLLVLDRIWQEMTEPQAMHSAIRRVLADGPEEHDRESRMAWNHLKRLSHEVGDRRGVECENSLREEIEAAYREDEWERVIALADQRDGSGQPVTDFLPEKSSVDVEYMRFIAYGSMDRFEKAVAVGEKLAERLGDAEDPKTMSRLVGVLILKASAHLELGDFKGAIASARGLVERFQNAEDYQYFVSYALILQAEAESKLGNYHTAISIIDNVENRFGDNNAPDVKKMVIRALVDKADYIRTHNKDFEAAIAIYDRAIDHILATDATEIDFPVAAAFIDRAWARWELGDFEGEIASYQELIELDRKTGLHEIEELVLLAFGFQSLRLAEIGRTEDALVACAELEQRLETVSGDWKYWPLWLGLSGRAMALMNRGDAAAALDAFRSAYAAFPAGTEIATRAMVRLVVDLIAIGAQDRDVVEILSDDDSKSRTLAPLVAALRERAGESVRVPAEVLEVAADIRKNMDENVVKGILTALECD